MSRIQVSARHTIVDDPGSVGLRGEAAALCVGEPEASGTKRFPEGAVFPLEIADDGVAVAD